MAEAEERIRARYKNELDTIAAHWEEKETLLLTRHQKELLAMDLLHKTQIAKTERTVKAINRETSELQNRTVDILIRTVRETTYTTENAPARQHGGPVRAGQPYLVGEAGPEHFVPSGSGNIVPNGASGGGVDPKDLARAVADALEGTRVDVDGRQLGRLVTSPTHQPLAVAELGGRR